MAKLTRTGDRSAKELKRLEFTFEVEHFPEADAGAAQVVGLEFDGLEVFQEHLAPFFQRSGKFAAIGAGQEARDGRGFRQNQLENVDVAVAGEQMA